MDPEYLEERARPGEGPRLGEGPTVADTASFLALAGALDVAVPPGAAGNRRP
jgi:hypothetical protein